MTSSCDTCCATVLVADAIVVTPTGAERQELVIEPEAVDVEPGRLLHVGRSSDTGRIVVTPLGNPSSDALLQLMRNPHAHLAHVCATVPTSWLEQPVGASG